MGVNGRTTNLVQQPNIKTSFRTSEKEGSSHARFKRGVIHLYNMVVCATGCNPLAYKGYGCYCGFLGSGYVIDGIDQYVIYLRRRDVICSPRISYRGMQSCSGYEFVKRVSGVARCTTGVTTPRTVPCSRNTSYRITGDVIMVISPFVVGTLISAYLPYNVTLPRI